MPIRFTATGDIDELKSLFNMVSAHADCLAIKTHALHKRKDLRVLLFAVVS